MQSDDRAERPNVSTQLQTILETIPSGILVVEGKDARITLANRRAAEILGQPPPVGLPLHLHSTALGLYKPDGAPFSTDELPVSMALAQNEPIWGVEMVIRRPDGKRVTVIQNAAPLHDERGCIYGAFETLEDITELAQLQEQLLRDRERLQTVLDTIPSGIIIVEGSEENISYTNRKSQEFFVSPPEPGITLPRYAATNRLMHTDGSPFTPEELPMSRSLHHDEVVSNEELVIETPTGHRSHLLLSSAPLHNEDGSIFGAVASTEDITPLVQAREELRQAYVRERRVSETLQQALLPRVPERIDTLQIVSAYRAALEEAQIGGDFFDVFRLSSSLLGVVVGDVSGKGVDAAARTALAKYTLRAYAYQNPSPSAVVESLNNVLTRELEREAFITLLFGLFDTQRRTFTYVNAGHLPPLCLSCTDGGVSELPGEGMAVGITTGSRYTQNTVELQQGDRILLYTDGVTEARGNKDFFGVERLKEFALAHRLASPRDFVDGLLNILQDWSGGHLRDDVAILLIAVE